VQYAIIILAVLIALYMVWSARRRAEINESFLRFAVPLPEAIEFSPAEFTRAFREQWGGDTTCDENPEWALPKDKVRRYAVADGVSRAVISDYGIPLPKQLTDLAVVTSHQLTNQERDDLQFHKAVLTVESVPDPEHAVQCVRSVARMLITLLKLYPGVGLVNVSSPAYHQRQTIETFMDDDLLSGEALFLLCASVHLVPDAGGVWMHTHGMQYFGLSDLEIRFKDEEDSNHYHGLLTNAAAYTINTGVMMKPGDTAEFEGDGVVYDLRIPAMRSRGHFGKYGALEIARKE